MNAARVILALMPALLAIQAWADDGLRRCRGIADAAQRLACYDALVLPAAGAGPAPAPAQSPTTATPVAPAPSRVGLPAAPERVDSRVEGRFEGWRPRSRIRLANGQVWQVLEDSSGSYWLDSPRAVVRPGALGSFVLEIDGVNTLIRVRRVE